MDSVTWWATVHMVAESDITEATQHACFFTIKIHAQIGKELPNNTEGEENRAYQSRRYCQNNGRAQGRADAFLGLVANVYSLKREKNFCWEGGIK